jgi:hypothetical protein
MTMVGEGMVYFLQQIGAILLLVFLLDLLIQWVQKAGGIDYPSKIKLKEVRDVQNAAWDRSVEILVRLDEGSEPWMQSISFHTDDLENSSLFVGSKASSRISNPRREREIILESTGSKFDETEDLASMLVMDMEVKGS